VDGVVQDADGADETGPEVGVPAPTGAVAGAQFHLGATTIGSLVPGRRTREKFGGLWPTRNNPFSRRMNAMPGSSCGGRCATWARAAS
jgi:hypothetical protein